VEKLRSNPDWDQIRQRFFETGEARPALTRVTELSERIALATYQRSLAELFPEHLALIAVGGFGRRELFPYSDVDLLLLIERDAQSPAFKNALSEFVRMLWDSGLRLSHSVHSIAECTELNEQNVELSISLLDRRLLAGAVDLYAKLDNRLASFFERRGRALGHHLSRLAASRHRKFDGTLYHLEPDVKETPGGLRDLHLIHWLAQIRHADSNLNGRLKQPADFLAALRCFLHYRAGRDQNLLNFDAQHEITQQPFLETREPPIFMREYFHAARLIHNEARRALDSNDKNASSLLQQFRGWNSRLSNSEFTISNERIFLRTPSQLENDPAIMLRLFEFIARHGIPLAAETERRLEGAHDNFARYCEGRQEMWNSLRGILVLPRAVMALRAMHDTGLLQVLFPEWNNITCLVVPDYYHRYTVDEHTLVAIEKLTELPGAHDPAIRRFAEVLSEIDDLALLRFALLFHDAGKGSNAGDHSRRSVDLARRAMARLQLPADDQSAVEFLIAHHLDLSAVMSSRDLHDTATAAMLAGRIGTIERLKLLVVLTYADISAVHPGAMTPWRLEQLWQTYLVTYQELLRELETERIQNLPAELPAPSAPFIKGFPVRYLRTHSPTDIQGHLELFESSRPTGVAVKIDRLPGVYRSVIVARDKPALFASLAGAISSFGMDIVKAEAFANAQGQILDTFVFADPKHTLELNPQEIERLEATLEQVALGKLEVETLLRGRPRPTAHKLRNVRPKVHFDSAACETATLVEIVAEDRPRLLYDLAYTFSSAGCNIDVVLIDTEGHRAIDVFYVASDGTKLTPELEKILEKRLLAVC
jgi:[protein-PII] uridylyltransferase